MHFRVAKTVDDLRVDIKAVEERCEQVRVAINVNDCDARTRGMVHVRQLCRTLAVIPMALQRLRAQPNGEAALRSIFGIPPGDDVDSWLCDVNRNLKASFITMVQFALENCTNHILDELGVSRRNSTFTDSARRLLKAAGLPECGQEYDLLIVPQLLRNSLHANGVHGRRSQTIEAERVTYEFTKGERIQCGSWSHILWAVLKALEVYEAVFKSPRIAALAHIPTS